VLGITRVNLSLALARGVIMQEVAMMEFQGNAEAISSAGLATMAGNLGVHVAEIWAVLAVETSGCGYLADRRPQILFERHVFHRLTKGKYDDGDISDPNPGGYGPRGAAQYNRLARAMMKDRNAALQSASWGIGQIMGMNHTLAAFRNVEDMVVAMSTSEDQQLAAMAAFLVGTGLRATLQAHDWASFARGYNGPNYAINRYDLRLNAEYQKYSTGILPDLNVRAAQLYLTYLGFHPGGIDGIAGQHTLSALAEFQANNHMQSTSLIDDACVTNLRKAVMKA
jgi:hypothetical protein